jgi:hypothetical protein
MSRHVLNRILLSLLLLVSQHMAFAHALTHWTGTLDGSVAHAERSSELSSAIAQDQTCDHCLALAQLAAPLAGTHPTFVPGDNSSVSLASLHRGSAHWRTLLGFNPRAPPQA